MRMVVFRTLQMDQEQMAELRRAAKRRRGEVRWRASIVLAYLEGASYAALKERFECSSRTIAKWVRRFVEEGVAGLEDRPHPPPTRTLRVFLVEWFPSVIHESPRKHGLAQDRWTLVALQEVCERQTGRRPSLESVRLALKAFGCSWKRAKAAITSPDPEYEAKKGLC